MKTTLNCLLALFAAAILMACGERTDTQVKNAAQPDQKVVSDSITAAADEQASAPQQLTGEQLFVACQGCHTLHEGEPNMLGPNLYGFMGESAATRPDYNYSPALKDSGLSWDRGTLTAWIVAPESMVPGTLMGYHNIIAADELALLIDYIEKETGSEL